jgi:predicted PurR-regulated permease PerM
LSDQETVEINDSARHDGAFKNKLQTPVLAIAIILGAILCYLMALPFLPVLVWAFALAVLFTPIQRLLESKLKRPSLAAIITTLLIALIVVVPAIFVGQQLFLELVGGAQLIENMIASGSLQQALQEQPQLSLLAEKIGNYIDWSGTINTFTSWLGASAGEVVKASAFQILGLCLIFYLLFFFLRDRHAALKSILYLSLFSQTETDLLFKRIGDTIYATVYGTFLISLIQGLLGGLMFWWLGLPEPLLWGVIMGMLAIIPVLGPFIIWVPAALFLALSGNWIDSLTLTFWGVFVVGTIDNLLYPILMGNRLKLHTILAFLSIVGGLIFFGSAGLIFWLGWSYFRAGYIDRYHHIVRNLVKQKLRLTLV